MAPKKAEARQARPLVEFLGLSPGPETYLRTGGRSLVDVRVAIGCGTSPGKDDERGVRVEFNAATSQADEPVWTEVEDEVRPRDRYRVFRFEQFGTERTLRAARLLVRTAEGLRGLPSEVLLRDGVPAESKCDADWDADHDDYDHAAERWERNKGTVPRSAGERGGKGRVWSSEVKGRLKTDHGKKHGAEGAKKRDAGRKRKSDQLADARAARARKRDHDHSNNEGGPGGAGGGAQGGVLAA